MPIARRLRAIFTLSATWAVAISALGTSALLIGLATGVVPHSIYGTREIISVAVRGLLVGGLAGALFGTLLSNRERMKSLSALSTKRTALWGFLAGATATGAVVFLATGGAVPMLLLGIGALTWGIGGALAGVGLLRLARRASPELVTAPSDDTHLLR